ncbi:MAG: hypothetical protein CM1200mP25_2060 [Acidobacteriota bacterium]|nr:MAG: hypothetical protein CM1200mP25_2060 [Acidobacteriota bacterium]
MTKQHEKDTLRRRNARQQVDDFFTRPLAAAAGQDGLPAIRRGPVEEIYAAPEFEQMAELVLAPMQFDSLKSSARGSFDKMTFRQRLMVYAMELDLTTELFGHSMFAPIIVGPVSRQGDLHDEGELATARGSSASQTIMVATRSASYPIAQIASETTQPFWFQVYADDDLGAVRADVAEATMPDAKSFASRLVCLLKVLPSPCNGMPLRNSLKVQRSGHRKRCHEPR